MPIAAPLRPARSWRWPARPGWWPARWWPARWWRSWPARPGAWPPEAGPGRRPGRRRRRRPRPPPPAAGSATGGAGAGRGRRPLARVVAGQGVPLVPHMGSSTGASRPRRPRCYRGPERGGHLAVHRVDPEGQQQRGVDHAQGGHVHGQPWDGVERGHRQQPGHRPRGQPGGQRPQDAAVVGDDPQDVADLRDPEQVDRGEGGRAGHGGPDDVPARDQQEVQPQGQADEQQGVQHAEAGAADDREHARGRARAHVDQLAEGEDGQRRGAADEALAEQGEQVVAEQDLDQAEREPDGEQPAGGRPEQTVQLGQLAAVVEIGHHRDEQHADGAEEGGQHHGEPPGDTEHAHRAGGADQAEDEHLGLVVGVEDQPVQRHRQGVAVQAAGPDGLAAARQEAPQHGQGGGEGQRLADGVGDGDVARVGGDLQRHHDRDQPHAGADEGVGRHRRARPPHGPQAVARHPDGRGEGDGQSEGDQHRRHARLVEEAGDHGGAAGQQGAGHDPGAEGPGQAPAHHRAEAAGLGGAVGDRPEAEHAVVQPQVARLGQEGGDGQRQQQQPHAGGAELPGHHDLVGGGHQERQAVAAQGHDGPAGDPPRQVAAGPPRPVADLAAHCPFLVSITSTVRTVISRSRSRERCLR